MSEYVDLEGEVVHATTRALRVRFDGLDEPVWIPRSCVREGNTIQTGDETLSIAEWFAEQNGLA